jgi:predicted Zn-dependent peptidase
VAYIRNEARRNEMRIRVSLLGGRAIEEPGAVGSMSAAAALWINGGAGGHAAEAITRYCSMWGMSFDAACGEEATKLDVVSSSAEPGQLARALALAALYLGEPDCETSSFARFMVRVDRSGKQLVKSLQRSTSRAFTDELFGDGERFRHQELTAESTAGLTLEAARDTLLKQLAPENMVVSVAGDFDAAELEAGLIRFFGTLQGVGPSREAPVRVDPARLRAAEGVFRDAAASPTARTGRVFVPDEANRSFQLIGFPSVGRWGTLSCADGLRLDAATATAADVPAAAGNGAPYCARMHVSRCLAVAMDVVQSRLFQEIREQRGLVYGISFGWRPFRHIDGGYCTVQLMPKQGEEAAALEEVQKALRAVLAEGITDEEFDAAKTPLVTKVEEKLVSNGFMLQLLEDLGYPESRKDLSCVRDVPEHYAALTKPQVERAMRECLLPGLDAMVVTLGVSGESDPAAPGADAPAP